MHSRIRAAAFDWLRDEHLRLVTGHFIYEICKLGETFSALDWLFCLTYVNESLERQTALTYTITQARTHTRARGARAGGVTTRRE